MALSLPQLVPSASVGSEELGLFLVSWIASYECTNAGIGALTKLLMNEMLRVGVRNAGVASLLFAGVDHEEDDCEAGYQSQLTHLQRAPERRVH